MGELQAGVRQPDQRSCGATCLVVARALVDPDYAALVEDPDTFRSEVLGMHRRTTSLADVRGHVQAPWPRALGTPPWAVARQLAWTTHTDYEVSPVRAGGRDAAYDALLASGSPAALYVGDRWLARHVVLVIGRQGEALEIYEPARGVLAARDREHFVSGELGLAGWQVPWFSVHPARRSPA